MRSRFLRFAIIGGLGFLVNAAVLYLALHFLHTGRHAAWFIAFVPSVTFTWWGNRNLTFHEHASHTIGAAFGEWIKFVAANGFGALMNFLAYEALSRWSPSPFNNPFVALAAGVLVGLVFNFTLSKRFVFRTSQTPE